MDNLRVELLIIFLCILYVFDCETGKVLDKPTFNKYDVKGFNANVRSHIHLILFHNSKCDTCEDVLAFVEEMAEKLEERQNMEPAVVATIDCDSVTTSLCEDLGFTELPTLAIFNKDTVPFARFSGDMILSQIKNFIYDDNPFLKKKTEDNYKDEVVAILDDSNFVEHISYGRHFVKFYVPWCAHCQHLAPIWEELGKSLKDDNFISISKVDCTDNIRTCSDFKMTSYPTLIYFKDAQQVAKYQGPREYTHLKNFVASMKPHHSLKSLIEMNSGNFNKTISEGATVVRFYDNECPNCQNTIGGWHDLVDDVTASGHKIKTAEINCRKNQAKCFEQFVYSVPSLVYYMNSIRVDVFRGSHSSLTDMRNFLELLKDKKPYELPPPDLNYVTHLSGDSLKLMISSSDKFVFVKFFVPWCDFCKALSPIWNHLALKMYGKRDIMIADVNCSEHNKICLENQIRGYPTMLLFHKEEMVDMYTGTHDVRSLHDYLLSMAKMRHLRDEL